MADRRKNDRRAEDKNVIKISLKDAIFWVVAIIVFTILISNNIILIMRNKQYKEDLNFYEEYYYPDEVYEEEYYGEE